MEPAIPEEYVVGFKGDESVSLFQEDAAGNIMVEVVLELPANGKPAYLERFFVLPRKYAETPADTQKHKGAGKKALCFLINKLVTEKKLEASDVIQLHAEATRQPSAPAAPESLESLRAFLKRYPGTEAKLFPKTRLTKVGRQWKQAPVTYTDEERLQGLKQFVDDARQNHKLIAYYETYGFNVVPGGDEGTRTLMRGTIGGILGACGKPTGAARKTRTRRNQRSRTRRHR